jgi:hypothetical protein
MRPEMTLRRETSKNAVRDIATAVFSPNLAVVAVLVMSMILRDEILTSVLNSMASLKTLTSDESENLILLAAPFVVLLLAEAAIPAISATSRSVMSTTRRRDTSKNAVQDIGIDVFSPHLARAVAAVLVILMSSRREPPKPRTLRNLCAFGDSFSGCDWNTF